MLKTYPPLSFKLVVKGTEELNYRIERRDCFRVAGISRVLARDMEENFKTEPRGMEILYCGSHHTDGPWI